MNWRVNKIYRLRLELVGGVQVGQDEGVRRRLYRQAEA